MALFATEDTLNLPLFQCKLCANRLQRPIIHVTGIGNICRSCYEKTDYRGTFHNTELEAFLEKLYFPCNYTKNGCTTDGSFNDICEHETLCCFREKNCPLGSRERCGNDFTSIDQLIDHCMYQHRDHVVTLTAEGTASVENPNKFKFDTFYLIVIGVMHFVLRAKFDEIGKRILYEFYSLNYRIDVKYIEFSIVFKQKDNVLRMNTVSIKRLRKGEFPYTLDVENASKITLTVLKSVGCLKNVRIKVDIKDKDLQSAIPTNGTRLWDGCSKCLEIWRYENREASNLNGNRSDSIKAEHQKHRMFQCKFRKCRCPVLVDGAACGRESVACELIDHIREQHESMMDAKERSLPVGTSSVGFYTKEEDVIEQKYSLSEQGQLTVLTKTFYKSDICNRYIWQMHFQHPIERCRTIISSVCTDWWHTKTIDVQDCLVGGNFVFQVIFQYAAAPES